MIHSHFIYIAGIIIIILLFICGVYGLIDHIFKFHKPRSLIGWCFCLILSLSVLAVLISSYFTYYDNLNFFDFLFEITQLDNRIALSSSYIVYFMLLTWDGAILLFYSLCFNWFSGSDANSFLYKEANRPPVELAVISEDNEFIDDIPDVTHDPIPEGHAFIIPCHNSSEKIRLTLERVLRVAQPCFIFVVDNGSIDEETKATLAICEEMSNRYCEKVPLYCGGGIRFGCLKQGSKTIAQFTAVYTLTKSDDISYVTLIDDDTRIPDDFSEKYIQHRFEGDESLVCLAYPLIPTETQRSWLPCCQEVEYLASDFIRNGQSVISSSLFASGAFSTWKASHLLDVFLRHDSGFHGDDLQQGLILHSLGQSQFLLNPEVAHEGPYKIGFAPNICVPTDVPTCFFHLADFIPRSCRCCVPDSWLKCNSCVEPSLFAQRAKSWDLSRQRFFLRFLLSSMSCGGCCTWRAVWIRVLCFYEVVLILNDWFALAMLIYTLIEFWSLSILALILHGFVFAWAWQSLCFLVFNFKVLVPVGKGIPLDVLIAFTFLYRLPTMIFLRTYAMLWNLLYYLPCVPVKADIIDQLKDSESTLGEDIEAAFYKPAAKDSEHNLDEVVTFLVEQDSKFQPLDAFKSAVSLVQTMAKLNVKDRSKAVNHARNKVLRS